MMKLGRWEIDAYRDDFSVWPYVFVADMRREPAAMCEYFGHDVAYCLSWLGFELQLVRGLI